MLYKQLFWPKWISYPISKPYDLLRARFGLGLNDKLGSCFQKNENFQCSSEKDLGQNVCRIWLFRPDV